MYSYEDRIRAVQLYIKLGKRIGATIRQLRTQPSGRNHALGDCTLGHAHSESGQPLLRFT